MDYFRDWLVGVIAEAGARAKESSTRPDLGNWRKFASPVLVSELEAFEEVLEEYNIHHPTDEGDCEAQP